MNRGIILNKATKSPRGWRGDVGSAPGPTARAPLDQRPTAARTSGARPALDQTSQSLALLSNYVTRFCMPKHRLFSISVAISACAAGAILTFASVAVSQEAAALPSVEQNSNMLTVDDFSDGDLVNNLGGESGGWVIDPDDEGSECSPTVVGVDRPEGLDSALRLDYRLESKVPAQSGYWTKLRNLDASVYDQLQFDVKGDAQRGFTKSFMVQIKKYQDKARIEKIKGSFRVENVTADWQTIRIPLNVMTGILDFANREVWKNPAVSRKDLDELVIVFHDRHVSQDKGTIYLDNIKFVNTGNPGPTAVDLPPRAREKTPTPLLGLDFAKFLIQRLQGFPQQLTVQKTFPEDDRELFLEVAKDTWKFFNNIIDRERQIPLDQVHMGKVAPISEGAMIGDYTNITNIGVYLMAVVSAGDLSFITKEDAVSRVKATLDQVENWEHHDSGFLYNYYDTTTAEPTSYFVSFIDSAWFAAALYVVKNAFPDELGAQCEKMLAQFNFGFFYDDVEQQMFHGYYANLNAYSNYYYGSFYSESRVGSYLAIARGEAPLEHWFRLDRVFPAAYTWQRGVPLARIKKTTLGVEHYGGFYEWKDLRFVPSWGGSAFEALMPQLVLDEPGLSPEGLGKNGEAHVRGQIKYALEELGYPVWGMSPSAVPDGGYGEFGAGPLGSKGYPAGVVTPHASILSVGYAPHEVANNIRELVKRFPSIYGEYGFYDAVSIETGHVAQRYLCLDQAMIFLAINNYLNNGAVRKRFHQEPIMQSMQKLLMEEKLFQPLRVQPKSGGGLDPDMNAEPAEPTQAV